MNDNFTMDSGWVSRRCREALDMPGGFSAELAEKWQPIFRMIESQALATMRVNDDARAAKAAANPPAPGPQVPGGWLHMLKTDANPWFISMGTREEMDLLYEQYNWQWSENYLCRVERGPREVTGKPSTAPASPDSPTTQGEK